MSNAWKRRHVQGFCGNTKEIDGLEDLSTYAGDNVWSGCIIIIIIIIIIVIVVIIIIHSFIHSFIQSSYMGPQPEGCRTCQNSCNINKATHVQYIKRRLALAMNQWWAVRKMVMELEGP